ncbi:hypothetical protein SteCoe_26838 [Stentor coeruleus]|uniref:Gamma-glutamylcyclotransferase family protein n=1 Tax=Stentor coeruleus TaxID=5963 RepID=A0A1R2BBZ8_9CILI|nr:hypothetical protein SteCoe_26838 [Stentor coeruleus]
MEHRILVYGSLRQGLWAHDIFLQGLEKKDLITVHGFDLYRNNGDNYPFIVKGNGFLITEMYEVNDEIMQALDKFEGCPNMYTREKVHVQGGFAWIYVYGEEPNARSIRIDCGDWVKYLNNRDG